MKICLNCGDKLLDAAKKCPTCGTKDNGFPIVDNNDIEGIKKIIATVPNPKSGLVANWEKNLAIKNMSLKDGVKYHIGGNAQKEVLEKQELGKKIAELEASGVAYCPKCFSTSLSANKKGFGIGKAVVGGIAGVATAGTLGLVALTAGNIGAKKVRATCLKCGHQFTAGQK